MAKVPGSEFELPPDLDPEDIVTIKVHMKLIDHKAHIAHNIDNEWNALGAVRGPEGLIFGANDLSSLPSDELDDFLDQLTQEMQGTLTAYIMLVIEQQRRKDEDMRKGRLN